MLLGKKFLPQHFVDQISEPKNVRSKSVPNVFGTVVVYITFLFFDSNGDLSKSFREYYHFASQYSMSLSLCFVVV